MATLVAPQTFTTVDSFWTAPTASSLGATSATYVDVANTPAKQLGDYYMNNTVPSSAVNVLFIANSRNAGANNAQGQLWRRTLTNGYASQLWGALSGVSFAPATVSSRREFGFDFLSSQHTSGTVGNTRTTAAYKQWNAFGTGSVSAGATDGPGECVFMEGDGSLFNSLARSMESANLPTKVDALFGSNGIYAEDNSFIDGDSLYVNSSPATFKVVYMKAAGLGSFKAYGITSATSGGAGTRIDGYETDTIDASTTAKLTKTFGVTDTYNSGAGTLEFGSGNPSASISVGDIAVHEQPDGSFGGVTVVTAVNSTTVTFKDGFTANLSSTGNKSKVYFSAWSYGVASIVLPATDAEYRGLQYENTTAAGNCIIGYATHVGTNGIRVGHAGQSGAGYQLQIDRGATDDIVGKLCAVMDMDLLVMHQAEQSSTTDAMISTFAGNVRAASSSTEIYLAGDSSHDFTPTVENSYETAILGQTTYAGGGVLKSEFVGSFMEMFSQGHISNEVHPNMIGHAQVAKAHLFIMSQLSMQPVASRGNAWGVDTSRASIPKFIPEHLRNSIILTNRGWEQRLAGSSKNKGYTEVIVAGNFGRSAAQNEDPAVNNAFNDSTKTLTGSSGSAIDPYIIEIQDPDKVIGSDSVSVASSSGVPTGLSISKMSVDSPFELFMISGTPSGSGTGTINITFDDTMGGSVDVAISYNIS